MYVTFRPLPVWPHPETPWHRRRSRYTFRAGWRDTLELLKREIAAIGGTNVVIGAGFRESDLQQDGWPRADAREPSHPGIEVSFDSKHGRLVYATDTCEAWEHNVRSIALGLEALRAVDRYGITRRGEQYAGWRALPAGPGDDLPKTETEALELLFKVTDTLPGDKFDRAALWRDAVKVAHPDRGGSEELFRKVQAAKTLLGV